MTFVNDDGEVLDFDGFFAMSKKSVSFFNSKIQGDYSINFSLDNNSETRRFLNYDGPQMLNQVAFTRQAVTAVRNGNNFARGFIVIQSDNGDTLSCYFISGNSNWVNLLNGLITELDYTGVTNVTNYETTLTPQSGFLTATSGIVFPIIDWGFGLNKGWNDWDGSDLVDVKGDDLQSMVTLYPCFYLHTLVTEITKQNGLKISGNLINDSLYKSLVISPVNGQIKRPDVKVTTAYGASQSTASAALIQYTSFTAGSNPDGLFSSNTYTVGRNSKIRLTLTIVSSTVPGGTTLEIAVRLNGIASIITFPTSTAVSNFAITTDIVLTKGSLITVSFRNSGGAGTVSCTLNIKFDIPSQITAGDYLTPDLFLPSLRSIDVLKFIVNYFGCSVYYDEYSKTIQVNCIEQLKTEDADDWSQYYVSHTSNYTISSARNNYQRLEDPEDSSLKAYNKGNTLKYGEGNIETDNTLKEVNDLFKIPFAPSDFGLGKNGVWVTSIPLIKLKDSGEPIEYQSITNVGGRNSYNYTFDFLFTNPQLVRIVDDVRGDIGIYATNQTAGVTAGAIQFSEIPWQGFTGTGKLYPQEIQYQSIKPRLLVNNPATPTTNFSSVSSIFTTNPVSFAHFCKPATGFQVDKYKANAAFNNPQGAFSDPTVNDLYFRKITNILGNPTISAIMILPEAVFQSFIFDRFIYLKTANLTGYFWVDSINQYQDSNTPVQVNLLMI